MPGVLFTFNTQLFICMEPEVRAFLIRIAQTISIVLLWMLINLVAGIKFNLAFFEDRPAWFNYLYYVLFVASLGLLIWHLRKKWKM
jgi:hypothetical protein